MSARDMIRSAVFGQVTKNKVITFAGVEVEIRQPPVGALLSTENTSDKRALAAKMLCDYCYVPGTNEKVFDDTDQESILAMPFNKEWQHLQEAISELTDLDALVSKEGNG